MDDDVIALVRQLCTRAGIIMEDVSASAILAGTQDTAGLASIVERVRRELDRGLVLLDATGAMMGVVREHGRRW